MTVGSMSSILYPTKLNHHKHSFSSLSVGITEDYSEAVGISLTDDIYALNRAVWLQQEKQ